MRDNKIIGKGWVPTTKVLESAEEAYSIALKEAGVSRDEIQALGTTGYGRFLVGNSLKAQLIQEEITVNSKGAVYLADKQKGNATVIDIGGMDNKAISVQDGIPGMFTMGGICAGASGRFFEMISKRLGVDITELGALAVKGMHEFGHALGLGHSSNRRDIMYPEYEQREDLNPLLLSKYGPILRMAALAALVVLLYLGVSWHHSRKKRKKLEDKYFK